MRFIYSFRINGDGSQRKHVLTEGLLDLAIAALDTVTGLDAGVEVHVGEAEEADLV